MINVKYKLLPGGSKPVKPKSPLDAGFDLRSRERVVMIPRGERVGVSTGLCVNIPHGWYGQIQDRSGLAAKYGITTLAGVIDSGYTGEIKIVMLNTGAFDYRIDRGGRVAQLVFLPVPVVEWNEVADLGDSVRGLDGFGSSGV